MGSDTIEHNNNDGDENITDTIDAKDDISQQFHSSGRPLRMNGQHVKDTKDDNDYAYVTDAKAAIYGLEEDNPTVTIFLHV